MCNRAVIDPVFCVEATSDFLRIFIWANIRIFQLHDRTIGEIILAALGKYSKQLRGGMVQYTDIASVVIITDLFFEYIFNEVTIGPAALVRG